MSTQPRFACSHCGGHMTYEGDPTGVMVSCPHCNASTALDPASIASEPAEEASANPPNQSRTGSRRQSPKLQFVRSDPQTEPSSAGETLPPPPGADRYSESRHKPNTGRGRKSPVLGWLIIGSCVPLAWLMMVVFTHLGFWAQKDTETIVWMGVLLLFGFFFVALASNNAPTSTHDLLHWGLMLGAAIAVLFGYYSGKSRGSTQIAYNSPLDVVRWHFMDEETREVHAYVQKIMALKQVEADALTELHSQMDSIQYLDGYVGQKYKSFLGQVKAINPKSKELKPLHDAMIKSGESLLLAALILDSTKDTEELNDLKRQLGRTLPRGGLAYNKLQLQIQSHESKMKKEQQDAVELYKQDAQNTTARGAEIGQYLKKKMAGK